MSYYINAWLENGQPQLEIIDAQSKAVSVAWSYETKRNNKAQAKQEIQRLFRELLLLTCKQDLASSGSGTSNTKVIASSFE